MIANLKNSLRKKWILLKDKKHRYLIWGIFFAFIFLLVFYHVPESNYPNFRNTNLFRKNNSVFELIRYNRLKIWHRLNPALVNYTSVTDVLVTLPRNNRSNITNKTYPQQNAIKFLSFLLKNIPLDKYFNRICHIQKKLHLSLKFAHYIFDSLIHSRLFYRNYIDSVAICYLASEFPVINLEHFNYLIDLSVCTCNKNDLLFQSAGRKHMCEDYKISRPKRTILFTNFSTTTNRSTLNFTPLIKKMVKLVLLIHSAPGNSENRMAIRKTWGAIKYLKIRSSQTFNYTKTYKNDYHKNVLDIILKNNGSNVYSMIGLEIQLVFLLARIKSSNANQFQRPSSPSPLDIHGKPFNQSQSNFDYSIYDRKTESEEQSQKIIEEESDAHGDIVQGNFVDSYKNLTYKMIMGFKWVTSQLNYADYILKLDDDIFVDIFQVYSIIDTVYNVRNFYVTNRGPETSVSTPKLVEMFDEVTKKADTKLPFIIPQRDVSWVSKLMQEYQRRNQTNKNNKNVSYDSAKQDLMCDLLNNFTGEDRSSLPRDIGYGWVDDVILCNVWIGMPILRDRSSKWYVSEGEFKGQFFPPYCSGWAILLTSQAAYKLLLNAPALPYFWIDDVHVTGSLRIYSNFTLKNINNRFTFEEKHLTNWLKTAAKSRDDQFPPFTFGPTWGDSTLMLALWKKTLKVYKQYFTIIK